MDSGGGGLSELELRWERSCGKKRGCSISMDRLNWNAGGVESAEVAVDGRERLVERKARGYI
jgi:hypothetical protein